MVVTLSACQEDVDNAAVYELDWDTQAGREAVILRVA